MINSKESSTSSKNHLNVDNILTFLFNLNKLEANFNQLNANVIVAFSKFVKRKNKYDCNKK
jgi:hypothetical protein